MNGISVKRRIKRRKQVYSKYKGKCAYCGNKIDYIKMQVDHIIPIYRGWHNSDLEKYNKTKGANNMENLNPSCGSCNNSKGTFTLDEWRSELRLKIDRLRRDVSNFRLVERFKIIKINNKPIVFYFEKVKSK